MRSICLITCYMGPLQGYFDYFVASCLKNKSVNFIIINNTIEKSFTNENIQFLKLNLTEINEISSKALGKKTELKNPWKINELKPLFGIVFQKQLVGYDHWGWCDLDIIWGDLRSFLTDELLTVNDVITSKTSWTAGHFTLFKNNDQLNSLYTKNKKISELLNDVTYYAFEECCHRWDGKFRTISELEDKNLPVSMFDIVKNTEKNGALTAHFSELVREYPHPINYLYEHGKMFDVAAGSEFMYYHLITVKKIWRFYIPPYKKRFTTLVIKPLGIRPQKTSKIIWSAKRAYSCFLGIKKSMKTQKPGEFLKKLFRHKR